MKILIVDDDSQFCEFLENALGHDGHESEVKNSGLNTVNLLKSEYFDVVLLDVVMPDIDGVEVMKEIRSADLDIPVIVMTGGGDRLPISYAGRIMEMMGARIVLNKPFTLNELREALKNATVDRMGFG